MEPKLTRQLNQVLQSKDPSDFVEVIVELYPSEEPQTTAPLTRDEKIAQSKAAFEKKIGPLEQTIKSIGGEITGQAWINETLRVRVPADKVGSLSDLDDVAKLDVPHSLIPD